MTGMQLDKGAMRARSPVGVVVTTMVIGAVQARAGSTAMLLVEAALGVLSVAIYAALVVAWRAPIQVPTLQPAIR